MGALLGRLMGSRTAETDDDTVLGCDMAPAPSLLAAFRDGWSETTAAPAGPATDAFGPFTSSAQAPIRDS